MSQVSRPWQSTTPGDAGPYSSENWRQAWKYMIGQGAARGNVGPFLGSGTQPNDGLLVQAQAVPSGSVDVLPGSALVQGGFYLNDATVALSMAGNASGQTRIDTIILRANYAAQTIRLAILQGTPAASPVPPTLTQSAGITWEVPLADITLASGFTTIANAVIQPRHEWANAPAGVYLDNVLNNSGGVLNTGDVVIVDVSADQAVTTTTTHNHKLAAGVWVGRTANGGYGRVQTHGVGLVLVNGAYARGTGLVTSTTAKQAGGIAGAYGNIGVLVQASSGAGQLRLAILNVQVRQASSAVYSQRLANTTAGPTYANGTNTVVLNTEVSDPDDLGTLAANQVTITPGVYFIEGIVVWDPQAARSARVVLYDVGATSNVLIGLNNHVPTGGVMVNARVEGYIKISVPTTYELRIWTNGASAGATLAVSSGDQENYAELIFHRIG